MSPLGQTFTAIPIGTRFTLSKPDPTIWIKKTPTLALNTQTERTQYINQFVRVYVPEVFNKSQFL